MRTFALLLSAAVLAACDDSLPIDDDMGCSILAANHYGMTNRVVSVHHAAWFWHCEVVLPDRVHNGVLQYSRHVGVGTWGSMTWK